MVSGREPELGSSVRYELWRGGSGLVAVGAVLVVLGLAALVLPPLFGLTTALVLGGLFFIGGAVQAAHAIQARHEPRFAWRLVMGVLRAIAGLYLVAYPVIGAVALTAVLASYFVVAGAVKTVSAVQQRDVPTWGWLFFDGVVSVGLGLIAWAGFPASSLWLIGTLLGVELLLAGLSAVTAGMAASSRTGIGT